MVAIISSTALDALADDGCFLKSEPDQVITDVVQVIWLADIDQLNLVGAFFCLRATLDVYRRQDAHKDTPIMDVSFTPSEGTINFQTAGKTVSLKIQHIQWLASMAPHH